MIISLVLTLLVTASGTIATYLYDEGSSFAARICAGACLGLTALGLVGFVLASSLGLTATSIGLTVVVLIIPFLTLKDPARRQAVQRDVKVTLRSLNRNLHHPDRVSLGYFLYYAAVSVVLWRVFDRAMVELPSGISTGVINNFGDLPFHLSVITGFAYGNNFPPEDPTYAGVRFTYPFLTDFVSAIFVRSGADLRQSMFIENFVVAFSFVGLLHRWALELVKDRLAAIVTPLLVLLSGGLGWVLLWTNARQNEQGLWGALKALPASITVIPNTTWRWGNAISALLVPQRGILLGLPLAVIVFTQWWLSMEPRTAGEQGKQGKGKRGTGKEKTKVVHVEGLGAHSGISFFPRFPVSLSVRRMAAAGIVAGLLPLVHAHSFIVVMGVGACLALLHWRWREWITFFVLASIIALPQMWWSTHHSAVNAASFFDWQFGWDRGTENVVWFWFKNTGFFIPLIAAAILWRGKDYLVPRRLLFYYLPFTLCFIVPNLIKMAPWVWDNIKILFYWWLASAPIVALLLARLWHAGGVRRVLAVLLFASVTLAGSLDVASIALRSTNYQIFDLQGVRFAEMIKQQTEPRALIVHAPVHNHPVFLTGRRSLMGYPGHIWTHGLGFTERETEIKRIYSGAGDTDVLLRKYGVDYIVVGPLERNVANVNGRFFSQLQKIGEVGDYRLYKITQP
ncbi:MAG: hypothetical protein ABJB97_01610 [Acidobacteriota bacterium]